ncbi:phosphoribosyltransferase [Weissella soli]|jgi:competence protein ComFC|nr:phosphoribosyltransferase [Weissella soli]
MQCEYCQQHISQQLELSQLLWLKPVTQPQICETCHSKFTRINSAHICAGCGRSGDYPRLCSDCQAWQQHRALLHNRAIYHYDEMMRWYFEQYKFNGGYHLRTIFAAELSQTLANKCLVPIPVTKHTMATRGFNQTLGLLDDNLWIVEALRCKFYDKVAQSKKNRVTRLQTQQPFAVTGEVQAILDQPVILVDDVYTTGRTLYHAADCLHAAGVKNISSMTLAR